jgi:hypothetical protein
LVVIIGGGIVDVVIVTIGNSGGEVRGRVGSGIPGSAILRCIKVPVSSGGRASYCAAIKAQLV